MSPLEFAEWLKTDMPAMTIADRRRMYEWAGTEFKASGALFMVIPYVARCKFSQMIIDNIPNLVARKLLR